MRRSLCLTFVFAALFASASLCQSTFAEDDSPMSRQYWEYWNDDVQKEIDERIEKYRKADCVFQLDDVKEGSTVKIEQTNSDFMFGAHIFNFDQLGSDELNAKYKDVYGSLFNQATIAFYWKTLEPIQGQPR
ncbi:MAG: hypothetical protein IJM54_02510, partial [Thermoguttaceae bacterium]|nr:hypothetical protein [Thermoguttaceae bacterium]